MYRISSYSLLLIISIVILTGCDSGAKRRYRGFGDEEIDIEFMQEAIKYFHDFNELGITEESFDMDKYTRFLTRNNIGSAGGKFLSYFILLKVCEDSLLSDSGKYYLWKRFGVENVFIIEEALKELEES